MMAGAPMVFVVDDDPSVRRSLTRLIGSAGYAVEAFPSAREFLERERHAGPGCLVLDVRMPGLSGLDVQDALARGSRRTAIVFISGYGNVPTSVRAMKGGAVDFLTKPVDGRDLLGAIERALSRDARERSEAARAAEIHARVTTLTPREAEVLARVAGGMLNKQIAAALGIAEKTVKVHRARVMDKMRAGSVAELVRLADLAGVVASRS